MEALRLIRTARHALAEAREVPEVLAEARQAALLTEAVGARLSELDDGELAGLGRQLSEAGAHAAGCLDQTWSDRCAPPGWGGSGRAGRLTDLGELAPALGELGGLLQDVGEALVVLACGADTESLYWTCIDGVDAGAECKDVVGRLRQTVGAAAGEEGADTASGPGGVADGAAGPPPPWASATGRASPSLVLRLGPPVGGTAEGGAEQGGAAEGRAAPPGCRASGEAAASEQGSERRAAVSVGRAR
ncbi:DUF6099 family protein [Kitasatospora sp. NPDC092286]|uniref:DUF6099 family protein n=1 Tax=Kitasatospora sp. NPDC092286 TaxID=3364087 RepID=UPI0037FF4FCF